jgi:hypothetical protein
MSNVELQELAESQKQEIGRLLMDLRLADSPLRLEWANVFWASDVERKSFRALVKVERGM